jgi:hypothetical protein
MNSVKTNELKAGDWAAHMMDLPNCGGIQIADQGQIEKVEHCDMWGTPSETHTTVYLKPAGGDKWSTEVLTVHNSHTWIVRTLG